MQILCKTSNAGSDVRCPVCGQGFVVYWARATRDEQAACRAAVSQTLRAQHGASRAAQGDRACDAHPPFGFHLSVTGEGAAPAAAPLGTAAIWQTV